LDSIPIESVASSRSASADDAAFAGPLGSNSPAPRSPTDLIFDAALAVLWLGGAVIALYLKNTLLFAGFDGGYMRDLAQRQFEWHVPLFVASIDWFQGIGDIFIPINFRWFPSFIAAAYFGGGVTSKVVTYGVMVVELSTAIWFFGRSLGVSRRVTIAAALFTCLIDFPFYGAGLIYSSLPLAPQLETYIACALTMAAAFLRFGRRSWLADLPFALVILALLCWLMLASTTAIVLAGPFLLVCGISAILAAEDRADRLRKIGLFFAATALMVCGPGIYLGGLLFDTAAAMFPRELVNDRATFYFASILFHWDSIGPAGPLLVVFAMAGAVLAIFDRKRRTLRMFAITLLTYFVTRIAFAVLTIVFDFWRGPSPLYFEFFVIPLYAVFAAFFFARLFEFARRETAWRVPEKLLDLGLVGGAVVLAITFAATSSSPDYYFHFPERPNAFTELIARESGMHPVAEFRGRTANMTGRAIDRKIVWTDLHNLDGRIWQATGNDMRLAGLHQFGIPGLFQYGPTMTPSFYVVTSRLLALPGDKQQRNVSVLRNIKPRILGMLGVRFVVTDAPFDGAVTLRERMPYAGGMLYLYEIAHPNLGDYSPTLVTNAPAAGAIVDRLAAPDFDAAHEVLADLPGDVGGLVSAQNVRVAFDGISLRVTADSAGRSIIMLPLEFSRCLAASGAAGAPSLFRANLVETGVLFSGRLDAILTLRTGLFFRPWCRLLDYFDVRTLRVGDLPPLAADELVGPDK
jgi:hypothetical protein